jgi:hypothetical protein
MLAGKRAAAFNEATQGTSGVLQTLQARTFAGDFARWSAIIGGSRDLKVKATLDRLHSELSRYDMIDQVEILAARHLVNKETTGKSKRGREVGREAKVLFELAATLPPASRAQLGLLGLPLESI